MPTNRKPKSRVAKAGINKKSKFHFRWWMGVLLVLVVAGIGLVVLRFSHAAAPLVLTEHDGASNGLVANGSFMQTQETFANIVEGNDPNSVDHADIEVCWTFVRYTSNGSPATYTMEVLNWGGGQLAVQPDAFYVAGQPTKCIRSSVGSPDPNFNFYYKFVGTNENSLGVTSVTRRTLAVYPKVQAINPPPPNPTPTTPPPNPVQTLNFNAGQITTVCGYQAVAGYALICPQNIFQWQFVGYNSSWVGTWEQNQAKGVTSPHDSGYWKWGNFCGVKSHVVSDPTLIYYGGDHMYLVGCPTGQDILNFKTQNNKSWSETTPPVTKGRIYITKYGPHGPVPPNGNLKSNSNTVPGNTNVCIKNKNQQTFACGTQNPIDQQGILTADSPYNAYFSVPRGWKVSRVLVNGQAKGADNGVSFSVHTNETTFVDFYFDQ